MQPELGWKKEGTQVQAGGRETGPGDLVTSSRTPDFCIRPPSRQAALRDGPPRETCGNRTVPEGPKPPRPGSPTCPAPRPQSPSNRGPPPSSLLPPPKHSPRGPSPRTRGPQPCPQGRPDQDPSEAWKGALPPRKGPELLLRSQGDQGGPGGHPEGGRAQQPPTSRRRRAGWR